MSLLDMLSPQQRRGTFRRGLCRLLEERFRRLRPYEKTPLNFCDLDLNKIAFF
jgi:hypothetical protein